MSKDTGVNFDQDIFAALITKHDIQRDLCDKLENETNNEKRKAIYEELKGELQAHAAAKSVTYIFQ